MSARFEGTTTIVTGATDGIGASVVSLLVREGGRIVAVARRAEPGAKLERQHPNSVRFVAGDIRSVETAERAVAQATQWSGGVTGLVNNAAWDFTGDFLDATPEEISDLFLVNSVGTILMTQVVVRQMITQPGGGAIVNLSSRLASNGVPTMAIYGATKGAVEALTLGAAVEFAGRGVRVNAVAPGLTETPLFTAWLERQSDASTWRDRSLQAIPQGRFGQPNEVAALIAFLLSPDAAHITGAIVPIDGGFNAS